jgi:ubiquinone/menaquinone biosynthesis C-methylase UbiE
MLQYPSPKDRLSERANPSTEDKSIARKFDKEYFDGNRKYGYGGFYYNPKFWTKTVELFIQKYNLTSESSVLDVGCGKGFMLVDLLKAIPSLTIVGVDISNYAITHAHDFVKGKLAVANAKNLPFEDKSFDLVISVNTVHNLERLECINSIKEIERVKRKCSYIVVDGWETNEEKESLLSWVLTAKTMLSTPDWEKLFVEAGYTGDYSFWKVN